MDELKDTTTDPEEVLKQADINAGIKPSEPEEEAPAQSATKDEWVAYRKAQGHEDAEEMTKQELIDLS